MYTPTLSQEPYSQTTSKTPIPSNGKVFIVFHFKGYDELITTKKMGYKGSKWASKGNWLQGRLSGSGWTNKECLNHINNYMQTKYTSEEQSQVLESSIMRKSHNEERTELTSPSIHKAQNLTRTGQSQKIYPQDE